MDKGKRIVLFNYDLWFWGDDLFFKDKNGEQIDFVDYNLDVMIYGYWYNYYYKQLKLGFYIYCLFILDKGGIDYGIFCFRIYNVDIKGKLSLVICYIYIDGILIFVYLVEGEIVLVFDGKMMVWINVYCIILDVKKVIVFVE